MSYLTPFIIVRWGLSLIAGVLLARLLRKPVRVIITRLIPVRQRIADDFFKRLTRLSTITGAVIALSAALAANYGLTRLAGGWERTEQVSTQPTKANSWEDPAPAPAKAPTPVSSPPEETPTPTRTVPETYETPAPAKNPRKNTEPKSNAPRFYLQRYAFTRRENALRQLRAWPRTETYRCYLAHAPGDRAPYKILVGPFESAEAVRRYRRRNGLNGFPRSEEGLEIER